MIKYSAILITAILCLVCFANCTPSESVVQTAIASTKEIEDAILEETSVALQAATQEALNIQRTQEFEIGQTQTVEALAIAQTQAAIPKNCTPRGTYIDSEGDTTFDFLDILRVETLLEGENLTVTFFLANVPEEITINSASEGSGEYSWGVEIDVDQNPDTGTSGHQSMSGRAGIDYDLSLFHFSWGEEKTGPIENVMAHDAAVWKPSPDGGMTSSSRENFTVNYDLNTITLKGRIPGINEGSFLYFHTAKDMPGDSLCD